MILLAKLASYLLRVLPDSALQWLGNRIGDLWYFIVRFRRHTVLENLSTAFKRELSQKQLQQIARANFQHYGKAFLETIESLTWPSAEYRNRVPVEGLENIDRDQGGFLLCSHTGSWEVGAAALVAHGLSVDIVIKRSPSPFFENLISWHRKQRGLGLIVETGTAKDILRSLSKKRFVGFMLDQFMGPPVGVPVTFFGQLAGTPAAVALMTEKKNHPVYPTHCYRDSKAKLRVVIQAPIEMKRLSEEKDARIYQKTQVYNDAIESVVRTHPEQWLWLHRRWKAFRGEPKWKAPASILTALMICFLLTGCSSKRITQKTTGIPLPKEKNVSVPDFDTLDKVRVTERGSRKVEKAVRRKRTKKKIKKKEKQMVLPVFEPGALPFALGEQVVLKLRWMMIPAGTATLEVHDGPNFKGRPTFELRGHARSNALVDRIYSVDNRARSIVDKEALIPYRFELSMLETHQVKETRVSFDHVNKTVHYYADRRSKKWGNHKEDRGDEVQPFVKDLFTALYYVRTIEFTQGKLSTFPLYENGRNFVVRLMPEKKEVVNVEAGHFQCWKIKVELEMNNVLKPMGDVYMWLSDDSNKYLVKFDAKIKVGSVNGELIKVREHL